MSACVYFDPDEMAEIEEGIRAFAVIEPIVVRPVPDSNFFEIIVGERRWRAARNVLGADRHACRRQSSYRCRRQSRLAPARRPRPDQTDLCAAFRPCGRTDVALSSHVAAVIEALTSSPVLTMIGACDIRAARGSAISG